MQYQSEKAAISAYALYQASISITNLRQYESTSEKAAKLSDTAADQLRQIRTTQAAAAIASLVSFFVALFSALHFIGPGTNGLFTNIVAGVLTAGASVYIGSYWDGKGKLPLPSGYNTAVESTKAIRGQLSLIGIAWGLMSVFQAYNVILPLFQSKKGWIR